MSGSTGGNRILRADVFPTFIDYQKNVLKPYGKYVYSAITGSYNYSAKETFGDIDLVVQLDGTDKKQAKKDFVDYLLTLSQDIIVPFLSLKYYGKRYLNTGEIITVLYPMFDTYGWVQIDNIISLSPEETDFKNHFLSLPAIKQGLMLGLIKTVILEDPNILTMFMFKELEKGQEIEFNLSSSALTLRLVDLTPDYKTIKKTDVWQTTDWRIVRELLNKYDFNKSFEALLIDIKNNLHNPRSINRVKGIFKSMVSVKSGEKETAKGLEKQHALDIMSNL